MNEIKISYGSWGDEQEKENVEYEKKNKENIKISVQNVTEKESKMSKHTQGKWEVRNSQLKAKEPHLPHNIFVGVDDINFHGNKFFSKVATCTVEANANLIASAPEMLEMLNKCYNGEIEEPYNNDEIANLIVKVEGGVK